MSAVKFKSDVLLKLCNTTSVYLCRLSDSLNLDAIVLKLSDVL